jgi:hypothetical protein
MFNMNIKYTLPAGKKIVGDDDEKPADSHIPSPADYMMIAEENLFHPERKIPAEKKEEQPLPKPEFVLYGTLITDNISLAYLEDLKAPHSTPGRGKRQTALRKGDTLSGFTLKEIETEKIVMVRGEERIELKVADSSKPKIRGTDTVATKEVGKTVLTPLKPPTPTVSAAETGIKKQRKEFQDLRKNRREEVKKNREGSPKDNKD